MGYFAFKSIIRSFKGLNDFFLNVGDLLRFLFKNFQDFLSDIRLRQIGIFLCIQQPQALEEQLRFSV